MNSPSDEITQEIREILEAQYDQATDSEGNSVPVEEVIKEMSDKIQDAVARALDQGTQVYMEGLRKANEAVEKERQERFEAAMQKRQEEFEAAMQKQQEEFRAFMERQAEQLEEFRNKTREDMAELSREFRETLSNSSTSQAGPQTSEDVENTDPEQPEKKQNRYYRAVDWAVAHYGGLVIAGMGVLGLVGAGVAVNHYRQDEVGETASETPGTDDESEKVVRPPQWEKAA